jgi:hypothetical protein
MQEKKEIFFSLETLRLAPNKLISLLKKKIIGNRYFFWRKK